MIFEKSINISGEEFTFRVNSEDPIDYTIERLSHLVYVEFKNEELYPPTIVKSNIAGIDSNLNMFVLGSRFGVYTGYACESTGDIIKDIEKYIIESELYNDRVPPWELYKVQPTTYMEISKDIKWLDEFLNK